MKAPFGVAAVLILAACTPAQTVRTPSLEGTVWVAEVIGGQEVIAGSRATLQFMPDGAIAGKASCNNYFGGYVLAGKTLTMSQMGATRMACASALMTQEDSFLRILGLVNSYEVTRDGGLLLKTQNGETLHFRPQTTKAETAK